LVTRDPDKVGAGWWLVEEGILGRNLLCEKSGGGRTAETFTERFRGVKGHPYEQGFDLRLIPEKVGEPLPWRSPKMIFFSWENSGG
jgi:hypothetical protein